MAFGPFSPETTSKQDSHDIVASENAVILTPRNSNNDKSKTLYNLKGKNASLTIHNEVAGVDQAALEQFRADILAGIEGVGTPSVTNAGDPVEDAVTERAAEQITEAPKEEKTISKGNWILMGAIVALLFLAAIGKAILKHRRKKA